MDQTHRPGSDRFRRKPGNGHGARSPAPARPEPRDDLYGALDLGTNNCRLLIAAPAEQGFTVVDAFSRIVRLGERLAQTGRLSDEAMARTVDALRVCANKLKWRNVSRAAGGDRGMPDGLQRPRLHRAGEGGDRVGLEIIDRETEAGLAAVGAEPLVDRQAETALVFDIGGGSTEVLWMKRNGPKFDTVAWTSLAAGVVTVSEQFGGGVDVTPASFGAMRDFLRPMLRSFAGRVSEANGGLPPVPSHLLGTSGTVTTIAGVQLGLARYDRSKVDGCWLRSEDIGAVTDRLLHMTYEQRAANPCIGRERADLVLAGCAILEEIRLAFPAERIRVADRGLREGILTLLMKQDGTYGRSA